MKKNLSLFIVCFATVVCSAQIQVTSNGTVGIGGIPEPFSQVSVQADSAFLMGIYSFVRHTINDVQVAVFGDAASSTPLNTGRAYGTYGVAGNRTSGYNYGVYGELIGLQNGAGVFGTTSYQIPQINGQYAGYFYGNAYVTGTLTAGLVTTLSDARYKSNIQQINATALTKIAALNPVQYTMLSGNAIALANTEKSDTCILTMNTSNEDLSRANQVHYGLLAQEVKELYPELVYEDSAGVMSINYIELIPLLIQAVQDLSEQVSSLYSSSNATDRKQAPKQQNNATEMAVAMLYQNNPNPFTETTVISYMVPAETKKASIYIYNMSGEQLSKYDISVFGEGNITINANELYAGTFLYSLVVDGKLIDTKQMIITQ